MATLSVTSYIVVARHQRFGRINCLNLQNICALHQHIPTLQIEAVCTSECWYSQDHSLKIYRPENLKTFVFFLFIFLVYLFLISFLYISRSFLPSIFFISSLFSFLQCLFLSFFYISSNRAQFIFSTSLFSLFLSLPLCSCVLFEGFLSIVNNPPQLIRVFNPHCLTQSPYFSRRSN